MKTLPKLCWHGLCFCTRCVASLCLWTLWLALALLLFFQLRIALVHELPVPGFVLRALETRMECTGAGVSFGRTSLDPSGRILIEDTQIRFGMDESPAITARLVYFELNPWALLTGRVEPRQIRASGLSLWVPAMLSSSGQSESLVQDVELAVVLREPELDIHQFSARLAGMPVVARGTLDTTPWRRQTGTAPPLLDLLARHYPQLCRQLINVAAQLRDLEEPRLDLRLRPSLSRAALARINLRAAGYQGDRPQPFTTGPLQLSARVPLWGASPYYVRLTGRTEFLHLPHNITTGPAQIALRARIDPNGWQTGFRQADLTLDHVTTADLTVTAVSGRLAPQSADVWHAEMLTRVLDEGVALDALVHPHDRSGQVHARGRFDPGLLSVVGRRIGRDLRPFLQFGTAPDFDLSATFDAGAKFTGVAGRVAAQAVTGYHVTFDRIGGQVAFDGRRFLATDAEAHIGDNFARGSFAQDLASKEFRFLLNGRLDPPAIGGWFRDWWPRFWQNFDFGAGAPEAEVDVQGRWRRGWETTVFVYAASSAPVIRGVPLDHVRTLIYLRPHYYDGMEVFATRGAGAARGWFVRRFSDHGFKPRRLDFDFTSTLPLEAAGLVGPALTDVVAPFTFATPPSVRAQGYLAEETAGNGEPDRRIEVAGTSSGALTFHDFPLSNLSFNATLQDNDLLLAPVTAGFAHGTTTGRIRLDLNPDRPRLGFDLDLQQANLRQATTIVNEFTARRRGDPPPDPSTYVRHSAEVTMDISLSAEGDTHDPLSFVGTGNADLSGSGLGEIRLLGLLSELLNFTALKFNNLRANFALERDHLAFPEVSITGNNASVAASGRYDLDRRTLDFNARIYPFHESKFILKNVVGAVLSPLSTVMAVKLTGRLDNPKWAFVIGPTNFFRNLTQSGEAKPDDARPNDSEKQAPPAEAAPPQPRPE